MESRFIQIDSSLNRFLFALFIEGTNWYGDDLRECHTWCEERFGEAGETCEWSDPQITARWSHYGNRISIVQPEDAMEFRLRWC